MHSPFPFQSLLDFGFLSIMILAGVFLRASVPVFQKYLFPSCMIGGVIGVVLINCGVITIAPDRLETFAFHFFNISFISVGLTAGESEKKPGNRGELARGALWMSLFQGLSLPMQAIVGGLFVLLFGLFGTTLFKTFGFLAPLGFNEGPGQALSFGKAWESVGFEHAATIGLTFAAVGFFFAFIVGVPLANYGIKKGLAAFGSGDMPEGFRQGIVPANREQEIAGRLTFHSGNLETLAFQAAIIGMVYVITYFLVDFASRAAGAGVAGALWGFFFFWGMVVAVLVKAVMDKIGIGRLLDPGLQRRITGWSVDYLIVSTICAIQLIIVWQYILPVSLISLACGVLTILLALFLGKRIPSLNLERMLAIYGTSTGNISSGLLLLRIVDPEFKTGVAKELALFSVFVTPVTAAGMVLLNAPIWWGWGIEWVMAIFFGIILISVVLIRVLKLWGKPRF
ncbi:MAG: hypothetical protein MUC76_13475 [Spirochaetes bacterium]|nr:hypothetical protein [Spirochaetota bacterium]